MATIRQLSVTDVLADGYQMAVWGAPFGDTRRTALSTLAAYLGTDGLIAESKLTMATNRILGRTTAATGAIEELTVGTGLALTAGNISVDAEPDEITATYLVSAVATPVEALPFEVSLAASLVNALPVINLDDAGKPFVDSALAFTAYATSGTPSAGAVPLHGTSGRLRVGAPSVNTDATTKLYTDTLVDSRLTAAQRTAIDALTAGSTAAQIVAALQAV